MRLTNCNLQSLRNATSRSNRNDFAVLPGVAEKKDIKKLSKENDNLSNLKFNKALIREFTCNHCAIASGFQSD